MTVILVDLQDREHDFTVNWWNWRAIVEAIRHLDILDKQTVDGLHEPFTGSGIETPQANLVADAIEERLLPGLDEDDYLLLDGTITKTRLPEKTQWIIIAGKYRADKGRHTTSAAVLRHFIEFCRSCSGFSVG